tara:strand:- start:53 stop:463 length:411 start_codon:yes stop_codon:yes gene_type:complete
MYKILIKNIFLITLPIITFGSDFAFAHKKFNTKNEANIEVKNQDNKQPIKQETISLEDKIDKNFENFQSFEDSVKPENQFLNLFGINGFADQRLKNSSFKLWDTFEKEMSNQIGNKKLRGTDINNTYNGSLNTLGN